MDILTETLDWKPTITERAPTVPEVFRVGPSLIHRRTGHVGSSPVLLLRRRAHLTGRRRRSSLRVVPHAGHSCLQRFLWAAAAGREPPPPGCRHAHPVRAAAVALRPGEALGA